MKIHTLTEARLFYAGFELVKNLAMCLSPYGNSHWYQKFAEALIDLWRAFQFEPLEDGLEDCARSLYETRETEG